MFISNLQFLLSSILSLSILIDQETILDFLEIDQSFNTTQYQSLHGDYSISTPVSSETFKLIMQAFWKHYQHGLGFVDVENFAIFILVLRFIYLSRKYNIKTGFFITCIGFSAGYLWFMHLRDLAEFYMQSMWMCPLTYNLAVEFNDIFIQQHGKFQQIGVRFDSHMFYGPIIRAFTDITNDGNYRYDPISMLWTYLPTNVKFLSDKIYYFSTLKIIPKIYRFLNLQLTFLSGSIWYAYIVRINKRFCPYLVRWHWTFLITIEYVERPIFFAHGRLLYYLNNVLLPNHYLRESQLVTAMIVTLVTTHYILNLLCLLHALCGQYFYAPFFTETTEIHIGPRPKDSVYSGGHTVWQNKRAYMISRQASSNLRKYRSGTIRSAYSLLPRLWYGWLGRGNLDDLTRKEYEQYLKDKEKKESNKKAHRRDSNIRWEYRQERLKKRFAKLLAKFGIKINNMNIEDKDDDLYEEFKKFPKK